MQILSTEVPGPLVEFPAKPNRALNGGFQVCQDRVVGTGYGLSVALQNLHMPEGWQTVSFNDAAITATVITGTSPNLGNRLRNVVTTVDASLAAGQYHGFLTGIEGYDVTDLKWGTSSAK